MVNKDWAMQKMLEAQAHKEKISKLSGIYTPNAGNLTLQTVPDWNWTGYTTTTGSTATDYVGGLSVNYLAASPEAKSFSGERMKDLTQNYTKGVR